MCIFGVLCLQNEQKTLTHLVDCAGPTSGIFSPEVDEHPISAESDASNNVAEPGEVCLHVGLRVALVVNANSNNL